MMRDSSGSRYLRCGSWFNVKAFPPVVCFCAESGAAVLRTLPEGHRLVSVQEAAGQPEVIIAFADPRTGVEDDWLAFYAGALAKSAGARRKLIGAPFRDAGTRESGRTAAEAIFAYVCSAEPDAALVEWLLTTATSTGDNRFDDNLYLFLNPDVEAAVRQSFLLTAKRHWKRYGRAEGRAGAPLDPVRNRRDFFREYTARPFGVNVYGFFSTPSGLGAAARSIQQSLQAAGIPHQCVDIPHWDHTDARRDNPIRKPYSMNLIVQNADVMHRFIRAYGEEVLHGCYNIGYWFWELPAPRMDFFPAYRYVDEVWAGSEYARRSLEMFARVPVVRMPLAVDGLDEKAVYGREHFGIPAGAFVFCYIFDASSQTARKNPGCLIEAFRREFGDSREVLLFLKSSNGFREAPAAPNTRLFDGFMSEEEVASLHKAVDCFVSPHRAEGFGLNIAESMYFGKPVIATRYSANLDFMDDGNGYLIDCDLVPIREKAGPYTPGFMWAEPSIDHLRALLRRVFEDAGDRAMKGRAGRERTRCELSASAVGARIAGRLSEIRSQADLFRAPVGAWPAFVPDGTSRDVQRRLKALTSKPLISVLLPTGELQAACLRDCVDSVKNQWYPRWELCIAAPSDPSPGVAAVLASLRGRDPRIKVAWGREGNTGAAEISSGELLARWTAEPRALDSTALLEIAECGAASDAVGFVSTRKE